jgi:hypothetical protein
MRSEESQAKQGDRNLLLTWATVNFILYYNSIATLGQAGLQPLLR